MIDSCLPFSEGREVAKLQKIIYALSMTSKIICDLLILLGCKIVIPIPTNHMPRGNLVRCLMPI